MLQYLVVYGLRVQLRGADICSKQSTIQRQTGFVYSGSSLNCPPEFLKILSRPHSTTQVHAPYHTPHLFCPRLYKSTRIMSAERNDNGGMNPTAAPFIPFASPQPSFATQRPKTSRSSVQNWRHENKETALLSRDQVMTSVSGKGYLAA